MILKKFYKTRRFGLSYAELALLLMLIVAMIKLRNDIKPVQDAINNPTTKINQGTGK